MSGLKLFMVLLGGRPIGRHTEQHDVFFGIATGMKELVPAMNNFWPEAKGHMHVDAWREVTEVDSHSIEVVDRKSDTLLPKDKQLFFINLGGYQQGLFDEPHFKMLAVHADKALAIKTAKQTAFYKTVQFAGAVSHIDDKFGVDVDDIHEISDILPASQKQQYSLRIYKNTAAAPDELHLGYFKFSTLP